MYYAYAQAFAQSFNILLKVTLTSFYIAAFHLKQSYCNWLSIEILLGVILLFAFPS